MALMFHTGDTLSLVTLVSLMQKIVFVFLFFYYLDSHRFEV